MRRIATLFTLSACWLTTAPNHSANYYVPGTQSSKRLSLDRKLDKRIERFDTAGRTLVASLVGLAYDHKLPLAFEYVDRAAATVPINLELHNESVRGILAAIITQAPEYQVTFSDGLVDIYSPKARKDPSNLLNKVIENFAVTGVDTHRADMELLCALARKLVPPGGCGGSIAVGQWGPLKVTVSIQNATVYEILNAIVAQNGNAIWTVMAPPEKLSKVPFGGLWHIYPLEPPFKDAVLDRLSSIVHQSTLGQTIRNNTDQPPVSDASAFEIYGDSFRGSFAARVATIAPDP